ncbi:hypothetical protein [Aeromicrobium sp. Sec7.5]|uniref:hypothetical protein n=1 Tax=Aeromicrobium sp. Sec7.5 TaxID=3121276 RepID=UPI002FE471B2
MATWLSSAHAWPTHPETQWRDVMREAHARGWFFRPFSDHAFGKISCAEKPDSLDSACATKIYSSATGSETYAKRALTLIRTCPHSSEQGPEPDDHEAARLLKDAERLLEGATSLLSRATASLGSDELLEQASRCADDADTLLAEAEVLELEANRMADRASAALAGTGLEESTPSQLVIAAEETLSRADQVVAAEGLAQRIERAQDRCAALKLRLRS